MRKDNKSFIKCIKKIQKVFKYYIINLFKNLKKKFYKSIIFKYYDNKTRICIRFLRLIAKFS